MRETHVVTSFLVHEGKILILKRSDKVGSFPGAWAGISGYIEEGEAPLQCAIKEIREETGLKEEEITLISAGDAMVTKKDDKTWVVHPFLFETEKKDICLDWEHEQCEWIDPKEIEKYETVPDLKKVLESVTNAH
ncbi:MAG: NUDIX pyrophosphatase [Candidatus Aenigmarchaeota archaeon]|nr:NUDIX pyrophosphatase [Candidatus Aenigmarchaeota archaeon]